MTVTTRVVEGIGELQKFTVHNLLDENARNFAICLELPEDILVVYDTMGSVFTGCIQIEYDPRHKSLHLFQAKKGLDTTISLTSFSGDFAELLIEQLERRPY